MKRKVLSMLAQHKPTERSTAWKSVGASALRLCAFCVSVPSVF